VIKATSWMTNDHKQILVDTRVQSEVEAFMIAIGWDYKGYTLSFPTEEEKQYLPIVKFTSNKG